MISSITKRKTLGGGFTVIETIIYAACLILLISVIVTVILAAYRWYGSAMISSRADQVGEFLTGRISSDLRAAMAYDLAASSFGSNDGYITMTTKQTDGSTRIKRYGLDQARMTYGENGQSPRFISPAVFEINRFYLTASTSPVSRGVGFEIELSYEDRFGPKTSTYAGFAVFRNSYE